MEILYSILIFSWIQSIISTPHYKCKTTFAASITNIYSLVKLKYEINFLKFKVCIDSEDYLGISHDGKIEFYNYLT